MREATFDAFYHRSRAGLLGEAFVLTGDLAAAAHGTRDAYVSLWHHWARVAEGAHGEASEADLLRWTRHHAWRSAQRRHTGRVWHRPPALPPDLDALLQAVQQISGRGRRLIVATHVAGLPLADAAQEIGRTPEAAAERLARAEQQVVRRTGLDPAELPVRLRELARAVSGPEGTLGLPGTPAILRSGARRRRGQAAVVGVATIALTLGVGALARQDPDTPATGASPTPTTPTPEVPAVVLTDLALTEDDLDALPGRFTTEETSANTEGDGLVLPCQQARYADPAGLDALVRTFTAPRRPGRVGPEQVVQTIELSEDRAAARAAYDAVVGWLATCDEERAWLRTTFEVSGVGEEAVVVEVDLPGDRRSTRQVAVARTGAMLTAVAVAGRGDGPSPRTAAALVAAAVDRLCTDAPCTGRLRVRRTAPPETGEASGLLTAVDLPPPSAVTRAWVGTDAEPARRANPAATPCDATSFADADRPRTRTFLVPGGRLPVRFGLAQTVGELGSVGAATRFVDRAIARLDSCADREVTAEVVRAPAGPRPDGGTTAAWTVTTAVAEDAEVVFRVGVVRVGRLVTQVTFLPAAGADLAPEAFAGVLRRAGERLRERA